MSRSASPSSRLTLFIPFALLAAAVIIHGAYWVWMSGEIRAAAHDWIEEQEEAGYTIAYQDLEVTGYPFRFSVRASDPHITAPAQAGGWSARYQRLAATAQFYNLNHWILVLDGAGEFAVDMAGGPARYRIDADAARVSVVAAGGATTRLGAEFTGLALTALEGPEPVFSGLDRLVAEGLAGADDTFALRLEVTGARYGAGALPENVAQAFGREAELVRLDARLRAWPLLAATGDTGHWAREGGAIEVRQARLEWGAALISGSGELTLDALTRPAGRLSVIVSNPERLSGALVAAGLVNEEQGQALRLAALMAPPRQEGIALPLRLQDGAVFLGPARLGAPRRLNPETGAPAENPL
ncbi:DUF2125 domain-containing protein [Alkalicaulis satelles]|uniref:DUF2125 domain-containing protein n=1 Tax=Alkalicaulis satelles TaxID=2609175 RepID=A0A5M6ZGQ0_9PROT|nr:DUF2125 domain-containing protein [Alkalicaulis satelles]KAA5803942.1 DUF2125 domain-containing protein [Alkalicaulis satelles]